MDVSFAQLVTPAGTIIAAGIITGLVQLLKTSIPIIDARISGASLAFIISAALYVTTAAALLNTGEIVPPDGFLGVFLAWLAAATSAVGIKATFDHAKLAPAKRRPITESVPIDRG